MATPKNEAEWEIYRELMERYKLNKGAQARVEAFKNDQKDTESWEVFKEFEDEFA